MPHPDGRIFFVRGTWPGDAGIFEITALKKNYGEARLHQLTTPSPERREAPCPHHGLGPGLCGGCPWMIVPYPAQLKAKEQRLRQALSRSGLEFQGDILPLWPAPSEWGQRNRAQFKTDGKRLGYVTPGTKILAPIEECRMLNASMENHLQKLRQRLPLADWEPTPPYVWNFLDVDDDLAPNEVVINQRRPFKQGNTYQNERMKEWLKEKLAPLERKLAVVELFCGAGNFTEVIAELGFARIVAAEVQGDSLKQLKEKKLPQVEVTPLDLFLPEAFKKLSQIIPSAPILILDPPREGLQNRKSFFEQLKGMKHIFYISCDLDSFIRDAKDFARHGFALQEVQGVDQFPQTPHLEVLTVFRPV